MGISVPNCGPGTDTIKGAPREAVEAILTPHFNHSLVTQFFEKNILDVLLPNWNVVLESFGRPGNNEK